MTLKQIFLDIENYRRIWWYYTIMLIILAINITFMDIVGAASSLAYMIVMTVASALGRENLRQYEQLLIAKAENKYLSDKLLIRDTMHSLDINNVAFERDICRKENHRLKLEIETLKRRN